MTQQDDALHTIVRKIAGKDATPRGGQTQAVAALRQPGARVLVVQATGWGKSVVYWAATAERRAAGGGPTIIVCPLLSLMADQVRSGTACGLEVGTINSANHDTWDATLAKLENNTLDALLISPERLANNEFMEKAGPALATAGLLVIDEAHCISDWGNDFRPDYQRVAHILLNLSSDAAVLACTATANDRVVADVATQLGEATVIRGELTRKSLHLSVVGGLDGAQRYGWVDQALCQLDGSGIIYTLTVAEAEKLGAHLNQRGHNVATYTGATDAQLREKIETDLRNNTIKAVVATSALGMGYDKPDLAYTIHVGSPASPVTYYQQIGRAGRSLDSAQCILLPCTGKDEKIWHYFATATLPDPVLAQTILDLLSDRDASIMEMEEHTGARKTTLETLLKQLHVDGAVEKNGTRWSLGANTWHYDGEKYANLVAVRKKESDLMAHYAHQQRCLMSVLVEALSDPGGGSCGQCSVCTGVVDIVGSRPADEFVQAAQKFLRSQTLVIEPRKRWPRTSVRKGVVVACGEGRALAYGDDDGWADVVAEVHSPDGEASDTLVSAMIALLNTWRPAGRSIVVCAQPGEEMRLRSLAAKLGAHFSVPVHDPFSWTGPKIPRGASGMVVAQLENSLTLAGGADIGGPVLLLNITTGDRWAETVAGALLREAGVDSVEPLTVWLAP